MHSKRPRPDGDDHGDLAAASASQPQPPPKRQRTAQPAASSRAAATAGPPSPRRGPDLLSQLPAEVLIRILSYLSVPHLLSVAPVSTHFCRLAHDNQLWKALYYTRFVIPRAMRIPGVREGVREGKQPETLIKDHKRALWPGARPRAPVRDPAGSAAAAAPDAWKIRLTEEKDGLNVRKGDSSWMRQFKIRDNWARGKCAVEELRLAPEVEDHGGILDDPLVHSPETTKMLVKVVEGLAVTVDWTSGLRVWDLKARGFVAQAGLQDDRAGTQPPLPSCIATDDGNLDRGTLGIAVGFADGSFGVWELSTGARTISLRYRHDKSSNGELIGMAYSYPYLLTATRAVLASLYTFDVPPKTAGGEEDGQQAGDAPAQRSSSKLKSALSEYADEDPPAQEQLQPPAPRLMTMLKSHSSSPPLALSIRKMARSTVASIAYTFFTRHGWSIGVQAFHITHVGFSQASKSTPLVTTRLAYTTPTTTSTPEHGLVVQASAAPWAAPWTRQERPTYSPTQRDHPRRQNRGPTTLCYNHPYLLATLPDNTLVLYICTSTASALTISPGIRLWGHTSGISDAEITARGKAVSVSSRGDEMRVWDLEGRSSGVRSRSTEVRAAAAAAAVVVTASGPVQAAAGDWEERRSWVGFNDEMVIVLKEGRDGRESLLVYDFT